MLIAYFSWDDDSYTQPDHKVGYTHRLANEIARVTGADEFEIKPAKLYPEDYESTKNLAIKEMDEGARPEIQGPLPDVSGESVVFLGYPIWMGEPPMAVRTFMDAVDLNGKTVVPFATCGGSGWANSLKVLHDQYPTAEFRQGLQIEGVAVDGATHQIDGWLEDLGYVGQKR